MFYHVIFRDMLEFKQETWFNSPCCLIIWLKITEDLYFHIGSRLISPLLAYVGRNRIVIFIIWNALQNPYNKPDIWQEISDYFFLKHKKFFSAPYIIFMAVSNVSSWILIIKRFCLLFSSVVSLEPSQLHSVTILVTDHILGQARNTD